MKTSRPSRPRLFSYVCVAGALTLIGHYTGVSYGASAPAPATNNRSAPPATPQASVPSDPYAAFLHDIATRSEPCKKHSEALQGLLKQREQLLTQFQSANPEQQKQLASQVSPLDEQISAEERALNDCYASNAPAEPPQAAPPAPVTRDGKPITPDTIKQPYIPPVPKPAAVAVPPPSSAESAYLNFHAARAAEKPAAGTLLQDLRELVDQRREAAVRYLTGAQDERPYLAGLIQALSQRISETAAGIDDALEVVQNAPGSTPAPAPASPPAAPGGA